MWGETPRMGAMFQAARSATIVLRATGCGGGGWVKHACGGSCVGATSPLRPTRRRSLRGAMLGGLGREQLSTGGRGKAHQGGRRRAGGSSPCVRQRPVSTSTLGPSRSRSAMAWKKCWVTKRHDHTCPWPFRPAVETQTRGRARSHLGLCRLAHAPGSPPRSGVDHRAHDPDN